MQFLYAVRVEYEDVDTEVPQIKTNYYVTSESPNEVAQLVLDSVMTLHVTSIKVLPVDLDIPTNAAVIFKLAGNQGGLFEGTV